MAFGRDFEINFTRAKQKYRDAPQKRTLSRRGFLQAAGIATGWALAACAAVGNDTETAQSETSEVVI